MAKLLGADPARRMLLERVVARRATRLMHVSCYEAFAPEPRAGR